MPEMPLGKEVCDEHRHADHCGECGNLRKSPGGFSVVRGYLPLRRA
jgi:hypothetical protein